MTLPLSTDCTALDRLFWNTLPTSAAPYAPGGVPVCTSSSRELTLAVTPYPQA